MGVQNHGSKAEGACFMAARFVGGLQSGGYRLPRTDLHSKPLRSTHACNRFCGWVCKATSAGVGLGARLAANTPQGRGHHFWRSQKNGVNSEGSKTPDEARRVEDGGLVGEGQKAPFQADTNTDMDIRTQNTAKRNGRDRRVDTRCGHG